MHPQLRLGGASSRVPGSWPHQRQPLLRHSSCGRRAQSSLTKVMAAATPGIPMAQMSSEPGRG
jgi:hypothetical protein